MLQHSIEVCTHRIAHLKARAAEGELSQSRLYLGGSAAAPSPTAGTTGAGGSGADAGPSGTAAAAAAEAGGAASSACGGVAGCADIVVSLEDLSKKVAQVYLRCVGPGCDHQL